MEQSDLELLKSAPLPHLHVLMRTRSVPLPFGKSSEQYLAEPEAINEVGTFLFNEQILQTLMSELETADLLILQELVACGGRANSRDLALYLMLSERLVGKKNDITVPFSEQNGATENSNPTTTTSLHTIHYPVAHPHGLFEQAIRRLLLLGLVFWGKQTNFANREYTSGVHDGVLVVPRAVRTVAHLIQNKQAPSTEQHITQTPIAASEGMLLLQRQLYRYWSCVAATRDGLALLATSGLLTRAALRQVVEHLEPGTIYEQTRAENDLPHLLFIRLLLLHLGLLRVRNGTLQAAPALAFFELPLFERVRRCYRLWLEQPFWNEMNYLPDVVLRPGPTPTEPAHEEVVRARQSVVTRLLQEQQAVWLPVNSLITRTKLYIPYLLFPRQHGPRTDRYSSGSNPYGWDFRLKRGWLTHREGWHMVEGGFVRTLLTGPLHWLGLVETKQDDNENFVRFSPLSGLLMSDGVLPVETTPPGRLIIQPNFEVVALAPVSEALLVQLDSFAERVSLELIAQYRITKTSVTHAIQMGILAETILAILERATGGELPQNVRYSLIEWERQARRIELWRTAILLEVDTAALLDDLFANEATRPLLRRRLSPLLAEVAPQHLPTLQALLWQRDYLPAVTTAPTQEMVLENGRFVVREPQWQLDPDGHIVPLYPVTDLYLTAEIRRFSTINEAGERIITAHTLQTALTQGLTLEYILRFLQQYCHDGIPPAFLIRLKLWGDGYGEQHTIMIEREPLLSLPAQILQDIQHDEELRPLLGAEIEQPQRFVRIQQKHLEQVIALLQQRGFQLE